MIMEAAILTTLIVIAIALIWLCWCVYQGFKGMKDWFNITCKNQVDAHQFDVVQFCEIENKLDKSNSLLETIAQPIINRKMKYDARKEDRTGQELNRKFDEMNDNRVRWTETHKPNKNNKVNGKKQEKKG